MKERKSCIKYVWLDGLNSSPHSQKPAIGPYCEPNKLRHLSSLFLQNPLNITFTAMLRVFQVDSFLPISPQKPCIHFHFPISATQPTHPLLKEWISLTISGDEWSVHIKKTLINHFYQSPLTSFLLGPNTFLSTMFSKTLSLCCSLTVSHPYKITGKFTVLCTLTLLDSECNKRFCTEWQQAPC